MPFAPATKYINSQLTFIDCHSHPAVSVFRGIQPSESDGNTLSGILPPLFSFPVYVTYGATLATVPQSFPQRFLECALYDMIDSDVVRFDIYFHPGSSLADIVRHYTAENRAQGSYATDANVFRGVAVILTTESWEADGPELLFFDPPPNFLESTDRENILGGGVTENGFLLVRNVALGGPEGLSIKLRLLAENNPNWTDLDEQYRAAVETEQSGL
ncbi:hypothetical protein F5Y19DRAFT_61055 [Xylariaceae sp. FL1651]|nr:hypothetical protein F5Y19DRAFT_61055 [Xylariaceae sp. FL1651]